MTMLEETDTTLLEAENKRVLNVLAPSLHRLLKLKPARTQTLARYASPPTPVLMLQLGRRQWNDVNYSQALNAFALLVEYSHRLRDYPQTKRAFWIGVLHSHMLSESLYGFSLVVLEQLVFAVDFEDDTLYDFPPPFVLSEDAVVAFFTTTPTLPASTQALLPPSRQDANGPDVIPVELRFSCCRLTSVSAVEAVERVVDRVCTHPSRHFTLSALDLSNNRMTTTELVVVRRIVYKCCYSYGVSGLRLETITPGFFERNVDRTPSEFLDIMRAVYGAPMLTNSVGTVEDISIHTSTLRSVSLNTAYACPAFFATLFSALRYGSPVHEGHLRYNEYSPGKRILCSSWYAFGLFYPRPKRFRKLLGLRDVGYLGCTNEVIEAFTETLHNPVTQLVYGGVDPTGANAAATELLVCTVKKGASVELIKLEEPNTVFILPRPLIQPDIHEIKAQCELEGLCERESDGAVCVIIPGIGLGWVHRDAVESIEREPLESAWGYQDERYAVQLGCEYKYMATSTTELLALIGNQIHSLSFNCGSYIYSHVPQIIQYCPNLQHLSLQSMYLPERGVEALLDTLQTGPLRTQLLTLNLNDSSMVLDSVVEQLAAVLAVDSNADRLAIQELRLHGRVLSGTTITALKNSLLSNCKLRLLQLKRAHPWLEAQQYQAQNQLSEVHDGLLLQLTLPMEAKLAFASVLSNVSSSVLDENLLALIFPFAGRDVRRVIAWTVDIDCS